MQKIMGLICLFATILLGHPAVANSNDRVKAQFMVDLAINHYATAANKTLAFKDISDPGGKFRDNEIYMFVFNPQNRVMLAHGADQDIIGKQQLAKVGDKFLIDEIAATARPQGNWHSYKWHNPASNMVENKTSWVRTFDGLVFGAGVYD